MSDNSSTLNIENEPISSQQINDAEFSIEETLKAIPELDPLVETAPEEIATDLKNATVVNTTQLTDELSSNLEPVIISDPIVEKVAAIDYSDAMSDIREQAIDYSGDLSKVSIDPELDSLAVLEQQATITLASFVSSIFSQGTADADLLIGTPGDDFFFAGGGDDIVIGLPGDDRIFGEAGNDFLIGGTGNDVVDGGTGDDLIFGDDSRTPASQGGKDVIRGGNGIDVIFAGGNNDTVFGDNDNDVINGESGRDILNGGDGDDVLDGGNGNDRLFGDSGNDLLNGGNGNDSLNAEDGDDVIIGGKGNDVIFGGRGNDTIAGVATDRSDPGFNEIDTLQGGSGSDLFQLGDADDFYYDDGQILSPGNIPIGLGDYGLIEDFTHGDDLIQLNGSAEQYVLESTQDDSPFNDNELPTGTAIYRLTDPIFIEPVPIIEPPVEELSSLGSTSESLTITEPIPIEPNATIELVGVVQDVDPSKLSLSDSSQFTFV
jgi:Ca2+-binding RTX toxin-like protein